MMTYRCTNSCKHCLYRCSSEMPDQWLSLEMAEDIFRALAAEPHLQGIHIAGGEPGLNLDLLQDLLVLAKLFKIPVDYVETNAFWCKHPDETEDQLRRLRNAGLTALLISVSPFHNEFIPFRNTRNCVNAARHVFGRGHVHIYLPHVYRMLEELDDDGTHTLDEFCYRTGLSRPELIRLYGLIPAGRVAECLRDCYQALPAEAYAEANCQDDLMCTTHFHFDPQGNLFTGCCAGVIPATVTELHPLITRRTRPIFARLCESGPTALLELATEEFDFEPDPDGYISKCDLCYDLRRHLWASGEFPELRPDSYYWLSAEC